MSTSKYACIVVSIACVMGFLTAQLFGASPKTSSIWGNATTDQQRCQAEANYMAKYRKFYHVGPCIGQFEGIGYGGRSPRLGTCTPRRKMRLTGDAVAQCANGTWVRVRSWR